MRTVYRNHGDKLNLADALEDYETGFIDGVMASMGIRRPSPTDISAALRLLKQTRDRKLAALIKS